MFGVLRVALRSFAIGVAVGVLFAPRAGAETRRMLNERFASGLNQLLEIAALPPIQPERVQRNGHSERPAARKRTSHATQNPDARTSSS
ncbi:MAG TPA: YtxH domain-containing protein [Candidatus Limnocylindria bacterium]|nr:YtxH domain-containing protein [Candidatus Limnocylindria bacterium]